MSDWCCYYRLNYRMMLLLPTEFSDDMLPSQLLDDVVAQHNIYTQQTIARVVFTQ